MYHAFGLVQTLNSPFFPLPLEAEPGREKRIQGRVQDNARVCLERRHFAPKSGEKPYVEVLSSLACGAIFWIIIYKQQTSAT